MHARLLPDVVTSTLLHCSESRTSRKVTDRRVQGSCWSFVAPEARDKAPNRWGVKLVVTSTKGRDLTAASLTLGAAAVELLVVMGVVTRFDADNTPLGGALRIPPHAWEWFLICKEHALLFAPHINVSGKQISALLAQLGALVGVNLSVKRLRSALVQNLLSRDLNEGDRPRIEELQATGGWSFGSKVTLTDYAHVSALLPHICNAVRPLFGSLRSVVQLATAAMILSDAPLWRTVR
jgi:hypothetical protein